MGPTTTDAAYARSLGDAVHQAIASVMQGRGAYALLDFPFHPNIGDSAIWMGEASLLRRIYGRGPCYVSTAQSDPDEAGRFVGDALVFLHGGGNFGDLWPGHQRYREAILARHRHNRIVCLPQSVHFQSPEGIESSRRAFAAHPDVHMMARDHESFDFMRRHYDCNVMLVPDSAFAIDMARVPRNPAPAGLGCLFREDHEQRADAAGAAALFPEARIEDWERPGQTYWRAARLALRGMRRAPNLPGLAGLMGLRGRYFDRVARDNVMRGFRQLDRHQVVVTDRLHGHIMAVLLGKPHVVIDNLYGKIARFIDAWPGDTTTGRAADYAEARRLATTLMAEVGGRR